MRWLRWPRRQKREWRRSARMFHQTQSGGPHPPLPPPAPRPRTLVEVLGLARTETVHGIPLTLLSLERYREGDVVTFSFSSRRGLHLEFPFPEIFLKVGPSAATETPRFSGVGSSGGGGNGQDLYFRCSFGFSPPMPDDATDWVVEVTKIEWVKPRLSPERQVERVDEGPWRFVIRP